MSFSLDTFICQILFLLCGYRVLLFGQTQELSPMQRNVNLCGGSQSSHCKYNHILSQCHAMGDVPIVMSSIHSREEDSRRSLRMQRQKTKERKEWDALGWTHTQLHYMLCNSTLTICIHPNSITDIRCPPLLSHYPIPHTGTMPLPLTARSGDIKAHSFLLINTLSM